MSEAVSYSVRDGIAIITMNNPPVNGLGSKLRPGIMQSLKKVEADAAVKAAVIWGSPKVFSGGADIREFNTPKSHEPPGLAQINEAQDDMKKPLVAAIGGFAMGGGLELALACHYRVAAPRAQLALPEDHLDGVVLDEDNEWGDSLTGSVTYAADRVLRRRRPYRESRRLHYALVPVSSLLLAMGEGGCLDVTARKPRGDGRPG